MEEEWIGGECGTHVCVRETEVHAEFWWPNLRDRNHLQDIDVDGKIILKWILKK